ncbi:MAG: CDP-glycerol glycerophosphotransferase family protein [Bacilli bacterium]|nr:CDP-glycerol glycerophosphotransferase family protein [Bacilli bacterium]
MVIAIKLFKFHLKIIYFFMKLRKTDPKKVLLISRESNNVSLDFSLLKKEMDKKYKVIVLTKKINKGFINSILYYFHILKQMYHLSNSKVCLVDTYIIPVSILKHKKDLLIIQTWHSLAAIKQFGYQTLNKESGRNYKLSMLMDMHKNYDYVISGSNEMIKYFSKAFNVDEDKFISIGLPRIDYLIDNEKILKNKIYKKYPKLKTKKTILYAPTFRRYDDNSIDKLIDSTDLSKYNLIVKTHPVKEVKFNKEKVFTCDEFSSIDLLTISDFLITDYSAIAIEGLVLDIPLFFYVNDYDEYSKKNGLNIDLFKELPGYTYKSPRQLMKKLDSNNYDMLLLKRFKDKYLTNQKGNSTKLIVDLIKRGK